MKTWKVTIENAITGQKFESESDMMLLHVADKLPNGLLETQSFIPSDDTEEDFRMFLSLGRAMQDVNFGWIHKDIGAISEATDIIKEVE